MSESHEPAKASAKAGAGGSAGAGAGADGGAGPVSVLDPSGDDSAYPAASAPRRFWSPRRVPAGIVAALLVAAAGLLLYDIAAVRAGRPAMHWRQVLGRELAERPLDDVWVLVGAGVAAALGLLLLVLALTPGRRALLPMLGADDAMRVALDRRAATMVLRDRAAEVSGVQSVRVRVKRRKARVRAVSHFRPLDDVHTDLDSALADGVRELGLARPPSLDIRVRRPGKKG
ncbi:MULTISPECIES: DUF6286 domain-containing protein [unclassified Streptomyces]|uniref:DUF6286 domain-containing protein n=1 Tax=unclassified Streptomyces TaxID=2593676 RepID=UPI00082382A8|nr:MULTISPECIES: DUF6286 domain-containing protein [unclassified Streptomyces]SCK49639.1 hypothetical protein YW7DRAFT_04468 [Streptomyces sp. AmelKG-E11A]